MKVALAIGLMVIGFALVVGGNVWYTRITVEHECQALNLILAHKGTTPAAVTFYNAVHQWAREDGC